MRQRIDITEVETTTKIRAKYLRALENEEWGLLPGPTFAKTFLRTYAEALGLDAKVLLEEYRQQFERPGQGESAAFGGAPLAPPRRDQGRRRSGPRRPILSPGRVVVLGILLILVALFALGTLGDDQDDPAGGAAQTTTAPEPSATPRSTAAQRRRARERRRRETARKRRAAARKRVSVAFVATLPVNVCLSVDGKTRLDDVTLDPATGRKRYRGRTIKFTVGNGNVNVAINGGGERDLRDTPDVTGYQVTARNPRLTRLRSSQFPRCRG